MIPRIAIILGTYNRLPCLKQLVASVRKNAGTRAYDIIAVDAGSTDGTMEWFEEQDDIEYLWEMPPLKGAVHAFNIGFEYAVKNGYPYIVHLNDDAELMTPNMLDIAKNILDYNPKIGEVAFSFDLRGGYGFDQWNGKTYANFGMIRLEAGMEVARVQGDPDGCKFWNPIYRTYGADTEFGCHLHRLGWHVFPAPDLKVHDLNAQDSLRDRNNSGQLDSLLFHKRWHDAVLEPDPTGRGPNPITKIQN